MREDVEVDIRLEGVQNGDVFLLCCDGLSGMVGDQAMLAIIRQAGEDLERTTAALVDAANQAGGVDNIASILSDASSGVCPTSTMSASRVSTSSSSVLPSRGGDSGGAARPVSLAPRESEPHPAPGQQPRGEVAQLTGAQ